jgi:hypothetical protein
MAQGSDTLPGMVFHEGLYAHDGVCAELRRPVAGEREACASRIGVIATPDDRHFMFKGTDGHALVFRSTAPPEYRHDNDLAIYAASEVIDVSEGQVYLCPGECQVESRRDGVSLSCTAWKKPDRKETCASARFHGNGVWLYALPEPD